MQRRTSGRGLGAVLFTDIVGSTTIAAEMGNTRWGELVSRHHRLIRRELRRFGGREQDTAGDGFFVAFERPVDAIRCAVAAANAVRELGIEIRAGVSFGQLELVEGKAGGLIVNTAARVMSVAGPGEVLVPAATKDLLPGAGISFSDHGVHRLKGIEGDVRLFAVRDVDGVELAEPLGAEEATARRQVIAPAASRRGGLVAGGIAAVVVAAVLGIWALADDDETPPGESSTASHFVVELDPVTGSKRQRIDFPDPGRPEGGARLTTVMAVGQGAVWTEDLTAYSTTVFRVDPRHREVRRVVVGGGLFTFSVATAFDAVWVLADRLARINPATYEVRKLLQIPLPGGGTGGTALAVDGEHLWIATADGLLLRVDPSGEVSRQRTVTDSIQLVAASADGVWVVDQLAGVVLRVDPESLRPVARLPFTGNVDAMTVLGEHVWTLDFATGLLTRISISGDRVLGQLSVPPDTTSLAAGLGAIWVAHDDGTITKVDPLTVRASRFARIDGSVRSIAVDAARDSVWVDVRSS